MQDPNAEASSLANQETFPGASSAQSPSIERSAESACSICCEPIEVGRMIGCSTMIDMIHFSVLITCGSYWIKLRRGIVGQIKELIISVVWCLYPITHGSAYLFPENVEQLEDNE